MKLLTMKVLGSIALAMAANIAGNTYVSAQSMELEIGRDGPKLRFRELECDPRYADCDEFEPRPRREEVRFCTEDRALDKAERMGIRRARVVAAGRRTIEVRGRDRYGDRVSVLFGREPRCPVLD